MAEVAEMAELELFSYVACPFAQRTRMVLIEKGITFDLTEIDLSNKPDWFKKLSPYGKVPLIRHQGNVIYESAVINEYLDEVFPAPPLMPSTPAARARARIWMHYCDTYFLPASFRLSASYKDTEKHKEAVHKLEDALRFIEMEGLRKLSDGPFWLGAEVGLVDLHYSPFLERLGAYEEVFGVTLPAECTRLRAWLAAIQERDSYQQTARTLDQHLAGLRRRLGLAA